MTLHIHVLLAKVNELFNYLTFVNEIHYYGFYFTMTQSQNVTVYAKVRLEAFGLLSVSVSFHSHLLKMTPINLQR